MRWWKPIAILLSGVSIAAVPAGLVTASPTSPTPVNLNNNFVDPSERLLLRFDEAERMTIPVQVGSGAPMRFLIDTGAERTGLAKERASELALSSLGLTSVVGFSGRQNVRTVLIPSLSFARSSRANVEALTFDGSAIGADGFLGIDSLGKLQVEFDFLNERMSIKPSPRVSDRPEFNEFDVRTREIRGRLIFSAARVNGVKTNVVLDTGSSLTIGNLALRERLLDRSKIKKLIPVYIMTITGDILKADYGLVDRLLIDGVLVHNLPVAFATVEPFKELGLVAEPALFLGMDALRAFDSVSVDFRHRSVRFVARSQYRPGTLLNLDGARW